LQDQRISTVLWRGKWIILASVLVGLSLAVLATKKTAKVYQASGMIQVNAGTSTGTNQSPSDVQVANQILATTYATELGDRSFLASVRPQILGGRFSTGDLLSRIGAKAVPSTALVQVTAQGSTPDEARQLASDVSRAFVDSVHSRAAVSSQRQQEALKSKIAALTAQIGRTGSASELESLRGARSSLQQQLANVIASGIQQGQSVALPSPPTGSSSPIRPRPMLNLIAGLLLGLLAGVGLSWARLRLDRGLHSSQEAEELLDVPVLASIPVRKRFSVDDPVLGEAYDVLRANLRFLSLDSALQVFTLSSYNPREGKSSTVEGLAFAAGRGGMSVAIIDGDVRTRTLSTRLGYDGAPGLTNVVVGATTLDEALVEIAPGISLLPTGPTPPNPPSLLASSQMRDLVTELRGRFSLVLIDSPPVAHLADASILASVSDGVIVVARVGTTARTDLVSAAANLRHSPTPIVGIVVLERRTIDETYYPAMAKGSVPQVTETVETV
jgi:capsular exopolysaccharide synthesis family protein